MSYTLVSLQNLIASGIPRSCVGHTKNLGEKCQNPISQDNADTAATILGAIRSGADASYVEEKIVDLATLCLCKKNHQSQCDQVVKAWKFDIQEVSEGIDEPYNALLTDHKVQRRKLRTATSKVARLELRVEALKQEKLDTMESTTYFRSEMVNRDNMINALRQQLKRQQDENTHLQNDLVGSRQATFQREHTISSLQQDLAASRERLTVSGNHVAGLEDLVETSRHDANNVRKALTDLRKHSRSLSSANSHLQSELKSSITMNETLRERNSVSKSNVEKLNTTTALLTQEVGELETQVETLEVGSAVPHKNQSNCGQRLAVLDALVKAQQAIHDIYRATTPAGQSQLADTAAALKKLQVKIQTIAEVDEDEKTENEEVRESLQAGTQCELM